ncbi:MAG: hypothetical protein NZ954_08805 [Thermofilaceae archaeon]|nr:hypothetical protein [Thermofilaceae archaeon]
MLPEYVVELKKEIEEILESLSFRRYLVKINRKKASIVLFEKMRTLLKQSFSSDYIFIGNDICFSPLFFDSLTLQRIKESLPFGKVYVALFYANYAKDPDVRYVFHVGGRKVIVIPLTLLHDNIMIVLAIELL